MRKPEHISSVLCTNQHKTEYRETCDDGLKNLARTSLYLVWNLARVGLHLEKNHRKMAAPPDEGSLESRISKSSTVLIKQLYNARVTRYNP